MLAKDQENQNTAESNLKITIEADSSNTGSLIEGIANNNDLVEALRAVLDKYLKQKTPATNKSKNISDSCWE
ncbi:hypothetical protein ABE41_004670 [Fictibacillus arsenicus]|uniref:Uncharacterized protein n=1 Tax=Fictibacillus arsenicus TaxID=255247 RepID=A0A1B1Z1U6_9BACL|nr:hypothetical protein [Fictibacillus arsenicus]ANX11289.1 hypothetical protein ABE41_004670 [Fictibacillus arsenicus]